MNLDELGAVIRQHLDDAEQHDASASVHRIEAGKLLIEARERHKTDKLNITWTMWCEENVKRSMRDIQRIMKIAGADDPQAALAESREMNREAVAQHRAKSDLRKSLPPPPPLPPRKSDGENDATAAMDAAKEMHAHLLALKQANDLVRLDRVITAIEKFFLADVTEFLDEHKSDLARAKQQEATVH